MNEFRFGGTLAALLPAPGVSVTDKEITVLYKKPLAISHRQ